ncbi:MAG: hypothetical protein V9E94_11390 [Microthrixaceae bacterium]
MSRIYYQGKYYDYPIKPMNALLNLGPVEAVRCVLSYLAVKVRPPKTQATLEDYIVANYGRRLFDHFFKTYNEKVWGVPASAISADWGAQRIKGMSIWDAVWEPIRARLAGRRKDKNKQVTSLIEEFQYPKYGPGQMWEVCTDKVARRGNRRPDGDQGRAGDPLRRLGTYRARRRRDGQQAPVRRGPRHLVDAVPAAAPGDGPASRRPRSWPPPTTWASATSSPSPWSFRRTLGSPTTGSTSTRPRSRSAGSRTSAPGRRTWSRTATRAWASSTSCFEGDDLWNASDEELIARGTRELGVLGLVDPADG